MPLTNIAVYIFDQNGYSLCKSGVIGTEHERRTEAESEPILSIYLPTTYPLPYSGAKTLYPLPYLGAKTLLRQRRCCPNIRFMNTPTNIMDPVQLSARGVKKIF